VSLSVIAEPHTGGQAPRGLPSMKKKMYVFE
jgi:hypothetical protein